MFRAYLADLVYDTVQSSYVVPLNIGFIAAALEKKFGKEIEIKLFKYPRLLEEAIRENPPDVLGVSNYGWNERLSHHMIAMAKRLNPQVVSVMGGPNIRIDPTGITDFLKAHPLLDYYVMFEGEEPFVDLITALLGGERKPNVAGCATLDAEKKLSYTFINFSIKPKTIDLPSPYLTGWLDPFLSDPKLIPLLETNRGCPFGCVYCAWGISALNKIRQRPIEMVNEEIDYIGDHSAKQVHWIFTDANFGILPRDVDIAKKVRSVMEKNGTPISIRVFQSKKTGERNKEISDLLSKEDRHGYIAIQSSDAKVLVDSGRGEIKLEDYRSQVGLYKEQDMEVRTDILLGLPAESAESHYKTIFDAFDMGFGRINLYNIRLIPGSEYETDAFRKQYAIKTKYRPIFGAFGVYDGKPVFEYEESVRGTKDMSEEELNEFKVIHWLVWFVWNGGFFRPLLQLGKKHGINPGKILRHVISTENPALRNHFDSLTNESKNEWFDTPEELLKACDDPDRFEDLVQNFSKLNAKYVAGAYHDPKVLEALESELARVLKQELISMGVFNAHVFDELRFMASKLICKDLLAGAFKTKVQCSGEVASILTSNPSLESRQSVTLEIVRPEDHVTYAKFYLLKDGKPDLSLRQITNFLDIGGLLRIVNKVKVLEDAAEVAIPQAVGWGPEKRVNYTARDPWSP